MKEVNSLRIFPFSSIGGVVGMVKWYCGRSGRSGRNGKSGNFGKSGRM